MIYECYLQNKFVGIIGNGGSSADAQHFASELVCTYRSLERPPIPAIAFTTDTSVITAWANDVSYESIFSRQVTAHKHLIGLLVAFSTSGRSTNICHAITICNQLGIPSVFITGTHDYDLGVNGFVNIKLPSSDTPVIQLLTSYLYHATCEILEQKIIR